MRILLWSVALLAAGALGLAIFMRLVPSDPARWHVDPFTVPESGKQNEFRVLPDEHHGASDVVAPVFTAVPAEVARAMDDVALSAPHTRRLAGAPADLWVTYVVRSRVFGFPDYVSVRVKDLGDGRAGLAIFSRARFGRSDFGVNERRVRAWLAALHDRLGAAAAPERP